MLRFFRERLIKNDFVIAILFAVGLWLIVRLSIVLFLIFIAFILTVALLPFVNLLRTKAHFPKWIAVLTPVVLFVALLFLVIYSVVPRLTHDISSFINQAPNYINRLQRYTGVTVNSHSLRQAITGNLSQLSVLGGVLYSVTLRSIAAIAGTVTVLFMTIYWLSDYENIKKRFASIVGGRDSEEVMEAWRRVERRLGAWVRGQIILSFVIGVLDFIAYTIIGVPFAAVLALMAGLFEVLPGIGPTLAAIPAVLLALTVSFKTAIITLAVYVLVQFLESHILAPQIMARSVDLNPLTIIIALFVGTELAGIAGAVLAVPVTLFLLAILGRREAQRSS